MAAQDSTRPLFPLLCSCGCGRELTGQRLRYYNRACKMRVWWQTHKKQEYPRRPRKRKSRAKAGTVTRTCRECRQPFTVNARDRRQICSPACISERAKAMARVSDTRRRSARPQCTCLECRAAFVPAYGDKNRKFCSKRCARRWTVRVTRPINRAIRKARERGAVIERFDPLDVLARDRWRCQLCGCSTPKRLRGYQFTGHAGDQVKQIGNSIPTATVQALVTALLRSHKAPKRRKKRRVA